MIKTDAYKLFVESREFTYDCSAPQNNLSGPGFYYLDQDGGFLAWIVIIEGGLFYTSIGTEECTDACLGKVEAFIWNNYAQDEWPAKINVYHKGDRYGN